MKQILLMIIVCMSGVSAPSMEFHVAKSGSDNGSGSAENPFLTIQRAADAALPGDIITVHAGIYREEVNPPRGGLSDAQRIIYRAAPDELVEIRGSEVVRDWTCLSDGVWQAVIPNEVFGSFNPFADEIGGDWFIPMGRKHHAGNVYFNGEGLFEAVHKEHLFARPAGNKPLVDMASFEVNGKTYEAIAFGDAEGVRPVKLSELEETCISWTKDGSWVLYDDVDFGSGCSIINVCLAIDSQDVIIEVRVGSPLGKRLGLIYPSRTGDRQSWETFTTSTRSRSGKVDLYFVVRDVGLRKRKAWFAEVNEETTSIWVQFRGDNPHDALIEVNARQSVFYPRKPFTNYITVRGFRMSHAAPKWAPPTAEQMGLIGTHWSKGWIIEENEISWSINVGISLGKYGDEFDNAGPTAQAYLDSIDRALANGWNKDRVGSHVVRHNSISYCGQAGIIGSMGAAFSGISGNHIHHIYTDRRFEGAEQAGIKLHGPVDVLIQGNLIHDIGAKGIWLDWMAQGTRISGNLLFRNREMDLFMEVNHGPVLVDNNIFLSEMIYNKSQGSAFAHNLFGGCEWRFSADSRQTPFLAPHSTRKIADHLLNIGDDRFYNNIFVSGSGDQGNPKLDMEGKGYGSIVAYGTWAYTARATEPEIAGNCYYFGALPYDKEDGAIVNTMSPDINLIEDEEAIYLEFTLGEDHEDAGTVPVSTDMLGLAKVPQMRFENPDGSAFTINRDYFGILMNASRPTSGPFAQARAGKSRIKVWPNPVSDGY